MRSSAHLSDVFVDGIGRRDLVLTIQLSNLGCAASQEASNYGQSELVRTKLGRLVRGIGRGS
jgi:hypothetical protein